MNRLAASVTFVAAAALTGVVNASSHPGQYIIDPALPGNTQYDGWLAIWSQDENAWKSSLSDTFNGGFPGYPGTGAWPSAGLGSHQGSTGHDAYISKIADGSGGGPFPSGASLYHGGRSFVPNTFGGTTAVNDTTVVDNLQNVVYQIEIGETYGYDFWDSDGDTVVDLPTLSYNGGSQAIPATYSKILAAIYDGDFTTPEGDVEPLYINTYLLQWDLSGVAEPITDFAITVHAVQHAQIYAMRLDHSDTMAPIPEPASLGLMGFGALTLLRRRRA